MGQVYRLIETVHQDEPQKVDQVRDLARKAELQCQSLIERKTHSVLDQENELRSQVASTQAKLQHLLALHTRDEPVTANEECPLQAIQWPTACTW